MSTSKRKPLTEDELADSARLKKIILGKKQSEGLTQQSIGLRCGWSGQQAVQAFISGNTPINLDAAFRFSKALGVPLDAISPRLAARAVELFGATLAGSDSPLAERYHRADNATRTLIDMALAQPNAPMPDGLSPSIRVMVDMARAAIQGELDR